MPRKRIDHFWSERIKTITANEPRLGPGPIAKRLDAEAMKLGRVDQPSERTIARLQKEFRNSTSESDYRYVFWPEVCVRGELPWEASGTIFELFDLLKTRPTLATAKWFWRAKLARPDMRPATWFSLGSMLASQEALGAFSSNPPPYSPLVLRTVEKIATHIRPDMTAGSSGADVTREDLVDQIAKAPPESRQYLPPLPGTPEDDAVRTVHKLARTSKGPPDFDQLFGSDGEGGN
jgi:hypothetical protein